MKVFVVMGNDYPDSVFSTQDAAEAYVEKKRAADPERQRLYGGMMIYWRWYSFDLDPALPAVAGK
jgi:hypothetical protein